MRRHLRHLPIALVSAMLIACAVAWMVTSAPSIRSAPAVKAPAAIDDSLLRTARQLASRADSVDELNLALEAVRVADHELDQAFTAALRDVATSGIAPKGPLAEIAARIDDLRARIAGGQTKIAKLTREAEKSDSAAEQLDLAKAQLALDQNELEDARDDLTRAGGDAHARIERALQEHQALQHTGQLPRAPLAGSPSTLADRLRQWLALRDRALQIDIARRQAASRVGTLRVEHITLAQSLAPKPDDATLADLQHLTAQRRTLLDFGKREQDCQQLAEVYKRWNAVLDTRITAALHQVLRSVALLLAIALAMLVLARIIRHWLGREKDRRRLHQMRVISSVTVQFIGIALMLLVIFGAPTEMSTIIGLTTAGLTVALKDYVVAFFGWFALIGKNGIHIGDWVEIEGVGGEVIEIGLLKTVLLEMGNWTNTGHPTGRSVAFVNKYAIENHYFNFSTAGQWLWDELQVTLPLTSNPYALAQQIRDLVGEATETDAEAAEEEWQRVTKQYGTRSFSARPALDLKPTVNGLDVVVRYITRAPQRYEVKSRLFEAIVSLLQTAPSATTR